MARKVLDNYPEFLKDFKEIEAFGKVHENELYWLNYNTKVMLSGLRVSGTDTEKWKEVIPNDNGGILPDDEFMRRFFKRHTLMDKNTVFTLIETVTGKSDFTLDFSWENLLFTVSSAKEFTDSHKKKIRQVIPCNTALEFLIVS